MTDFFSGYNPLKTNFVMMPIEVLRDKSLSPLDRSTLVFLTGLILGEQFNSGLGRFTPIPLSWSFLAQEFDLSESAIQDRIASLEHQGRIRVAEGPKVLISGRLMDGPNLYCLRWSDEPPTARLAYRIARRLKNTARLKARREPQESEGMRQHITSDSPGYASTHTLVRTPSQGYASDTYPSRESTEQALNKIPQSVSPSVPEDTDRPTERFAPGILEALEILDPPQVERILAESPWSGAEAWQILESIRVFGSKLDNPKGTRYNALLFRPKGNPWLSRVQSLFDSVGIEPQAEEETPMEDPSRSQGRKALAAAGLCRLPASVEVLEARKRILSSLPPAELVSPTKRHCSDSEAISVWESILANLRATLPKTIFSEWITPIVPSQLKDGILTVIAPSQSAGIWIDQQLGEDLYLAAQDTIRTLGIPPFLLSVISL